MEIFNPGDRARERLDSSELYWRGSVRPVASKKRYSSTAAAHKSIQNRDMTASAQSVLLGRCDGGGFVAAGALDYHLAVTAT
jgi:hypothetical protein